jgi:hypothetical protein
MRGEHTSRIIESNEASRRIQYCIVVHSDHPSLYLLA